MGLPRNGNGSPLRGGCAAGAAALLTAGCSLIITPIDHASDPAPFLGDGKGDYRRKHVPLLTFTNITDHRPRSA